MRVPSGRRAGTGQHLSVHVAQTGLLNRRGFADELERRVATVKRYAAGSALLIVDLDGLKQVNDRLGHETPATG